MELYLVRHGKTVWNKEGKLQGTADIELAEEGIQIARERGKEYLENGICFDRVFSSPLKRAYRTACLLTEGQNVNVQTDDRLREICFGSGEGQLWSVWFDKSSPYHTFFDDPGKYVPPADGESFESVMERTRDFARSVLEPLYGSVNRILVVGHGALNAALMCYLGKYGKENYWGTGLQDNCQANVFEYDGKIWTRNK